MINFNEVQVALVDFDDTLCIHKHIGVNRRTKKEWDAATFERDEDWYMDTTQCTYSPFLKYLLKKLNHLGTQCYGLTWSLSNGLYTARNKFVNHYYPNMLSEIFIVNERAAKVEFAKKLCETYGFSERNILIIEDHPDTQAEFREAGMLALSMSEICSHEEFLNAYVHEECMKTLASLQQIETLKQFETQKLEESVQHQLNSSVTVENSQANIAEELEIDTACENSTGDKDSVTIEEGSQQNHEEVSPKLKGNAKDWCLKAKDMIVKGYSNADIAKALGVKQSAVANLKQRMKKQEKKSECVRETSSDSSKEAVEESKEKKIDMGKLRALRNAGRTPEWIARDMNLDIEIVKEKLTEL